MYVITERRRKYDPYGILFAKDKTYYVYEYSGYAKVSVIYYTVAAVLNKLEELL